MNSSILAKLGARAPKSGTRDFLTLTTPAAADAAARWIAAKAALKSAEAAKTITESTLIPLVRAEWLRANAGKSAPVNSVEVLSPAGAVLGSFASVWTAGGGVDQIPADLKAPRFKLSVKSEAIPAPLVETLVDRLIALFTEMGLRDALEATGCEAPVPTFNDVRHARLTPEANEALEAAGLGTRLTFRVR